MKLKTLMTTVATVALMTGPALAQQTVGTETAGTDPVASAPQPFTDISEMTVGDVIGTIVYSPSDERIGEIDYVVEVDGQYVGVIGIGGFLGLGEYTVAIPLQDFRMRDDGFSFVLNTDKETLKAQPEIDESGLESLPNDTPIARVMDTEATDTAMADTEATDEEMTEAGEEMAEESEEAAEEMADAEEDAAEEMAEGAEDAAEHEEEAADELAEGDAEDATDEMEEAGEEMAEAEEEASEEMAEASGEGDNILDEAADEVSDAADEVTDEAADVAEEVEETVDTNTVVKEVEVETAEAAAEVEATAEAAGDEMAEAAAEVEAETEEMAAEVDAAAEEAGDEMAEAADEVEAEVETEMAEAELEVEEAERDAATVNAELGFRSLEEMTVGDVIGMITESPDGENIGEIDYVVPASDGPAFVIGIGGFLGLGEYTVAIKASEFELNENGTGFILPTDKETLKGLPEFDESNAESYDNDVALSELM